MMTDLDKIAQFSAAMLNAEEIDDLLWKVAQSIGEILGFEDCVIYVNINKTLIQKAAFGIKNPKERMLLNEITIPIGKGIVGTVAKTGVAEIISDTREDPRYIYDEFSGLSELTVPIIYENSVIAVIDTEATTADYYTEQDKTLLSIIANIAAPRIISAKNCAALHDTKTQLELTNDDLANSITQLRENQESLIHSEKMASIGLLAAGVAHEINNPLAFSISNISVLKEYSQTLTKINDAIISSPSIPSSLKELINKEQYYRIVDDIQDITAETESGLLRISKIVQDICNFARKNKNDNYDKVDINDCIKTALNLLRGQLTKSTEVVLKLAYIPAFRGNKGKFIQVVMNIVLNAIQAIDNNGMISITSSYDSENDRLDVSIQDNGCGINAQNLKNVFTPFYTTKPVGIGTGLGLFICYRIITEEFNGHIKAFSGDVGSLFKIIIPINDKAM